MLWPCRHCRQRHLWVRAKAGMIGFGFGAVVGPVVSLIWLRTAAEVAALGLVGGAWSGMWLGFFGAFSDDRPHEAGETHVVRADCGGKTLWIRGVHSEEIAILLAGRLNTELSRDCFAAVPFRMQPKCIRGTGQDADRYLGDGAVEFIYKNRPEVMTGRDGTGNPTGRAGGQPRLAHRLPPGQSAPK